MEYKELSSSGIKVSRIAFGAWAIGGWMWGGSDKKQAIEAIHAAIDYGVTTIDTAPVYGFGESETTVAEAIAGRRDKLQILTKYGLRWDSEYGAFYFDTKDSSGKPKKIHKFAGKKSVIKECEDSLRRLKTDYIDLYQIHWPDPTTPIAETMEAVETLKQQGKIRAAGVCNYSVEQMKEADKNLNIESNQMPYSMVNREIEEDLVPYCIASNKSIIAYSPLQRGVLTGKITQDYEFGEGDHRPQTPYFQEPNLSNINRFLKKIEPLAQKKNMTLAQLVINWTLQQTGITCALVGARNPKQAIENAGALSSSVNEQEILEINNHLDNLKIKELV